MGIRSHFVIAFAAALAVAAPARAEIVQKPNKSVYAQDGRFTRY